MKEREFGFSEGREMTHRVMTTICRLLFVDPSLLARSDNDNNGKEEVVGRVVRLLTCHTL